MTDDGLLVLATAPRAIVGSGAARPRRHQAGSGLAIVDTGLLDLVSSEPAYGSVGYPTGTAEAPPVLVLQFNREVPIPVDGFNEYLKLLPEDGSDMGTGVVATIERVCREVSRFEGDVEIVTQVCDSLKLTPAEPLNADASYRIELKGVLGSRRSEGLVFANIPFQTASDDAAPVEIVAVENGLLETGGGTFSVVLRNADPNGPSFLVGGDAATATLAADQNQAETSPTTPLPAGQTRWQLEAPSHLEGAAALEVLNTNGSRARRLGAVVYLEQVELLAVSPAIGSVNGGTTVRLSGRGFRPGLTRTKVFFGDIEVPELDVRVLDSETIEVITSAGRLGVGDVRIELDSGQVRVLEQAYEFQQPIQSSIDASAPFRPAVELREIVLDPSGTFAITAAGPAGIVIYNTSPEEFTTEENPVDLRRRIDRDGDDADDRVAARVPLPGGFTALGVAASFERNTDRVFVTGVNGTQARLFIVAFDSADIQSTTVVRSLALPTSLARGIEVASGHAVIAMGEAGLGVVDTFLQTRAYLVSQTPLPGGEPALDVERK